MPPLGILVCLVLLLHPLFSQSQVPGTRDIIQEFPEFTKEESDERRDSMDFEYTRIVALSLHGGYNVLVGGLNQTITSGAAVDIALNYFMYTQNAIVIYAGTSFAGISVNGTQNYTDLDGQPQTATLRYTGDLTMYRFALGYRYYFGHPASPTIFSAIGLNAELAGGILMRFERYSIQEDGPKHPGLAFFSDISPIFIFSVGVEFPFVFEDTYFGLRLGYQLSFLSDDSGQGYVNEPRDADWFPLSAYLMIHLD